jgi:hypothetical protein
MNKMKQLFCQCIFCFLANMVVFYASVVSSQVCFTIHSHSTNKKGTGCFTIPTDCIFYVHQNLTHAFLFMSDRQLGNY